MSYLVLARKSRPQTFEQVVGQKSVVKTLQNALAKNRVAHAMLFSGVRGVGKTTLARIMAKAVNCTGETADKPCDHCPSCNEIRSGKSLDLHEIDGASNRGIQEIRELKEKLKYLPTSATYKVIIIDEVHMLTTEAFNALLKTLEEPPAHVFFIFATTELHKIPITILSRCQRYELKRIPFAELFSHFHELSEKEGISIEKDALNLVVREAAGSIRDGLSLLDQLFAYGEKNITLTDVTEVFGLVGREPLTTICISLLSGNHASVLSTLNAIFQTGMDPRRLVNDLLEIFRALLFLKLNNCEILLDMPDEEVSRLKSISTRYSIETIHMKLNLLMETAEKLSRSNQPRLTLETMFINIIEAGNITPIGELLGKVGQLLGNTSPLPDPPPATPEKLDRGKTPSPASKLSGDKQNHETAADKDITETLFSEKTTETTGHKKKSDRKTSSFSKEEPLTPVHVTEQRSPQKTVPEGWQDFIDFVADKKIWMAQDLQQVEKALIKDNGLQLFYLEAVTCRLLMQNENHKILTALVLDFFKKDLKVHFIVNDDSQEGSGENETRKKRTLLLNDPLTAMVTEVFNGQAEEIRLFTSRKKNRNN